jgi:hypothetical protein
VVALAKNKESSSKPVNYTPDTQKITFDFLKAHLWGATDILRGSLDPADYRHPVMILLLLKRLNDTFEENAENLIKEDVILFYCAFWQVLQFYSIYQVVA